MVDEPKPGTAQAVAQAHDKEFRATHTHVEDDGFWLPNRVYQDLQAIAGKQTFGQCKAIGCVISHILALLTTGDITRFTEDFHCDCVDDMEVLAEWEAAAEAEKATAEGDKT